MMVGEGALSIVQNTHIFLRVNFAHSFLKPYRRGSSTSVFSGKKFQKSALTGLKF